MGRYLFEVRGDGSVDVFLQQGPRRLCAAGTVIEVDRRRDGNVAENNRAYGLSGDGVVDEDAVVFGRGSVAGGDANEKATRGWPGFLASLGVKAKPNRAELAERERRAAFAENETVIREAQWTRAVSVLVANPKGGTGKSPTALNLGGVLAAIRGSVVVLEVSDDPGKLLFRAEHAHVPALGLGELVRDVESITTAGQLYGYTAPQTTRAHVIGTPGRRAPLDGDAVRKLAAKLDEFYGIRVMDSGNQYTSSAFVAALETADVLVIPMMAAGDSATDVQLLLDDLYERGGHAADLASNAVVVRVIDGRTEHEYVTGEIDRMLDQYRVKHRLTVPYDQHIADREQLTFSRLSQETREAFTGLAATVVRQLQAVVSPVPGSRERLRRSPVTAERFSPVDVERLTSIVPVSEEQEPAPARDTFDDEPDDSGMVVCEHCGVRQPAGRLCTECGYRLDVNLAAIFTSAAAHGSYAEGTAPVRDGASNGSLPLGKEAGR